MSLLKRIQQAQQDQVDAEELRTQLLTDPQPSLPLSLQLCSAWTAWQEIAKLPVLKTLAENIQLSAEPLYPADSWAVVGNNGIIYANPFRLAPDAVWQYVLAHLLIHLGLRHRPTDDPEQAAVYELTANALLGQLAIGTPPEGFLLPGDDSRTDANVITAEVRSGEIALPPVWSSASGENRSDFITVVPDIDALSPDDWAMMLTRGLLENIGSKGGFPAWATVGISKPKQALRWFVEQFPLLSSLAAHFHIIEDRDTIAAFQISIAAVIAERMEIFVNPDVDLAPAELRFIMGHELMHVGLLHHKRRQERDPFLWNLACDFVINAWLIEMGVGEMPPRGGLYNPAYAGMSANEIYDKLVKDPNYAKQLMTFRGIGLGDILPPGSGGSPRRIGTAIAGDLAEVLMKKGINAHIEGKRGLLPAGLLEMVTPTRVPPPDWKIALAKWFEMQFEPTSPARTYARQSRRQQSTPDIPRPRYAVPQYPDGSGVFGVMLDTSGSMSNALLSQCLGAIASLAQRHNVKKVRLVFCDTQPHDEGFVAVKRLTEPMHVRGRGGTRLQPGINLLQEAKDFPKDAPILIITDAECDELEITRDHAFLIPEGKELPFTPIGPVFLLK